MKMAEFLILSGPIRSGKTSNLMSTFGNRQEVSGFLTPDLGEKRVIFDLKTSTYHNFETIENELNQPFVSIGKFHFLNSGFEICKQLISDYLNCPTPVFVIDEVGKLEMNGMGHEPNLSEFLASANRLDQNYKIIIVVRDTLVLDFCLRYSFIKPLVVSASDVLDII
jgi:nucleoside-triphosphatase THEP1